MEPLLSWELQPWGLGSEALIIFRTSEPREMRIEFKYLATRSGKSLILSVDNKKYLFNLFEGFQRYCVEACVRLNKISSIFLPSEDSIPPFVGTYLTLRDMGRESLEVICDESLQRIIDSANSFADRMRMKIDYVERYSDNFIQVESVKNKVSGSFGSCKKEIVETSYILNLSPIRGKLLVDKIPKVIPKNLYSELSRRRVFECGGRIYDGNEYVEDDVTVGLIGIIYSSGCYDELWRKIRDKELRYIFCFQREVAEYLSSAFEGTIFVLEDNFFVEYGSLYKIQLGLNLIYKDFLLPLPMSGAWNAILEPLKRLQSCDFLVYNRDAGEFNLFTSDHQEYNPGTMQLKDKSILFLGTGCAIPSKYRNVSAIVYESSDRAIMLDCGEDALFQIHRAYGNFDILRKLTTVFITHSHADHVLGIISVLKRSEQRIRLFGPLAVKAFIGQFGLENYDFVETNYAKILERRFIDEFGKISSRMASGCKEDLETGTGSLEHSGMLNIEKYLMKFECEFDITICGVEHCSDSCGIRVRDGNNVLAYSGDSRPSMLFGMMSSKIDVIIHEATFSSEQHERALQTGHSTISEAVDLFQASESRCLLLTHFSQRYSKGVISNGNWIPCVDLFRYSIGVEDYPADKINDYYEKLEVLEE